MPFVVAATWIAKPGEEGRINEVIRIMTPPSRAEEGNVFYQAQVSPESPCTFFLYEQYVDAEGYETHKATEHFRVNVVNYALKYLESREVKTFTTIDV